jgi:hypothetical protein
MTHQVCTLSVQLSLLSGGLSWLVGCSDPDSQLTAFDSQANETPIATLLLLAVGVTDAHFR